MIPVSYIMLDLGGIDLADVKDNVYPGLYNKIYSSLNACQEVILCNWFVAGILIPPTYCDIDISVSGVISFNDIIFIYSDDTIQIPTMGSTPIIEQLTVNANGTYEAPEGVDGFSPVDVDVLPTLSQLSVIAKGVYYPQSGVDGFSSVNVNVPGAPVSYNPPSAEYGNVGDYYIYLAPANAYLIKILKAARDNNYSFTYWGAKDIQLIFDDGEGNEVSLSQMQDASAYCASGSGSYAAKNNLINGDTSSYIENSGIPGYILLTANIPAGYFPKKLRVFARSDSWHDYWRTFEFGSSSVNSKEITNVLLTETDLEYSDWEYGQYTEFDISPASPFVPYLYKKTSEGWVLIK